GAVEARGGPEGPARRRGVGVPGAPAGGMAQLEPRHGAVSTSRRHRHATPFPYTTLFRSGRGGLPDLVAQLAEEGQADGRGWRGDREYYGAERRLAAGIRDRHITRAHRRRGSDREGDGELGGGDDRGRADRDAGAEGGAGPGLEVRARHGDGEACSRRSRAWRQAGDRGDDR